MTLQAGTVLVFGVDTPLKSFGLVQSYTETDTIKRAEAKAPDGNTVSIQEYKDQKSLELTYLELYSGSTAGPEVGSTFTFNGLPWQLNTVSDINIVDGFETISLTATWYPLIH